MNKEEALKQFQAIRKDLKRLQETILLIGWDLRSNAPTASVNRKLELIGHYAAEQFRLSTSENYGKSLKALAEPEYLKRLSVPMQITVQRELRDYERFCRVPEDFHRELVAMRGQCEKAWEQAKQTGDWELFAPWLEKNIRFTRDYALYMEPGQAPYNTLLAKSQEGMDAQTIESLFEETKHGVLSILQELKKRPAADVSRVEKLTATEEEIRRVQDFLLEYVGFDFTRGTTGKSVHGLTTPIDRNDVRITNNYRNRNPVDIMLTTLHESGHALYAMNVDPEYYDTALEELPFADLHESQSRFIENILGRNIAFWEPIKPKIDELYPAFAEISLEELDHYLNRVQLSQIRTASDELTYCLHIILRFELEKIMFQTEEIPSAEKLRELWNEKTKELFGFYPEDDAHGILQDLHWSSSYFGYFPSYLLGSIYDGMYLEAAEKELGSLTELLRDGKCRVITDWVKENLQRHGSRYNAPELIEKVCGTSISAEPMLRYFAGKHRVI